jgi:glycylpeptide N-tetradecanoyltransferase
MVLLNAHLKATTQIHPVFTRRDVEHFFINKPGVVSIFVVENSDGAIISLGSYYLLSSTILKHKVYTHISTAYCYYYVPGPIPAEMLIYNMLVMAKQEGVDVFNALNIAGNENWLKALKFESGNGRLSYYCHNLMCPQLVPKDIGLVLL